MQLLAWPAEKVPAAQVLHSLEPTVLEYLPGAQGLQLSWASSLFHEPLGLQDGRQASGSEQWQ